MIGGKGLKIVGLLIFLCWVQLQPGFAQDYKSEKQLIKGANTAFDNEAYGEAIPLYSTLVSNYPKDPEYNFKYGASLLYGGADKEKPIRYLQYAVSKPSVDPLAYYYFAQALHMNYEFEKAIKYYQKFKNQGKPADVKKYTVENQINQCENGLKLLKTITDLIVLDKKELREEDFYKVYDLSDFGGQILTKTDDFKSDYDKKNNKEGIFYFPKNAEKIFFSSHTMDNNRGKDIYFAFREPDGGWSKPINMGKVINTDYDDDYPFMHPDGKTLYFASKGHNSLGGYDIFVTTLNESGDWTTPRNLDFAINTPGDDYLFITDESGKTAYFSSNRESAKGEVNVYRINMSRVPLDFAFIYGTFNSESTKSANIKVKDVEKDAYIGEYETDENGKYRIKLPNKGKFEFEVNYENSEVIHSGTVEMNNQDAFKPLKQEMMVVDQGTEAEKLIIRNLLDEDAGEEVKLTADFLKERAKLEINKDDYPEEPEGPELLSEETSATETSEESMASAEESSTEPQDTTGKAGTSILDEKVVQETAETGGPDLVSAEEHEETGGSNGSDSVNETEGSENSSESGSGGSDASGNNGAASSGGGAVSGGGSAGVQAGAAVVGGAIAATTGGNQGEENESSSTPSSSSNEASEESTIGNQVSYEMAAENPTKEDYLESANTNSQALRNDAQIQEFQANIAGDVASKRNAEAEEYKLKAETLLAEIDATTEEGQQSEEYQEAQELLLQAEIADYQYDKASSLQEELKTSSRESQVAAVKGVEYSAQIQAASDEGEEASDTYEEFLNYAQDQTSDQAVLESKFAQVNKEYQGKITEYNQAHSRTMAMEEEIEEMESDLTTKKAEAENASGKTQKTLLAEIEQEEQDLATEKINLKNAQKENEDLYKEAMKKQSELEVIRDVMDRSAENSDITRLAEQGTHLQIGGSLPAVAALPSGAPESMAIASENEAASGNGEMKSSEESSTNSTSDASESPALAASSSETGSENESSAGSNSSAGSEPGNEGENSDSSNSSNTSQSDSGSSSSEGGTSMSGSGASTASSGVAGAAGAVTAVANPALAAIPVETEESIDNREALGFYEDDSLSPVEEALMPQEGQEVVLFDPGKTVESLANEDQSVRALNSSGYNREYMNEFMEVVEVEDDYERAVKNYVINESWLLDLNREEQYLESIEGDVPEEYQANYRQRLASVSNLKQLKERDMERSREQVINLTEDNGADPGPVAADYRSTFGQEASQEEGGLAEEAGSDPSLMAEEGGTAAANPTLIEGGESEGAEATDTGAESESSNGSEESMEGADGSTEDGTLESGEVAVAGAAAAGSAGAGQDGSESAESFAGEESGSEGSESESSINPGTNEETSSAEESFAEAGEAETEESTSFSNESNEGGDGEDTSSNTGTETETSLNEVENGSANNSGSNSEGGNDEGSSASNSSDNTSGGSSSNANEAGASSPLITSAAPTASGGATSVKGSTGFAIAPLAGVALPKVTSEKVMAEPNEKAQKEADVQNQSLAEVEEEYDQKQQDLSTAKGKKKKTLQAEVETMRADVSAQRTQAVIAEHRVEAMSRAADVIMVSGPDAERESVKEAALAEEYQAAATAKLEEADAKEKEKVKGGKKKKRIHAAEVQQIRLEGDSLQQLAIASKKLAGDLEELEDELIEVYLTTPEELPLTEKRLTQAEVQNVQQTEEFKEYDLQRKEAAVSYAKAREYQRMADEGKEQVTQAEEALKVKKEKAENEADTEKRQVMMDEIVELEQKIDGQKSVNATYEQKAQENYMAYNQNRNEAIRSIQEPDEELSSDLIALANQLDESAYYQAPAGNDFMANEETPGGGFTPEEFSRVVTGLDAYPENLEDAIFQMIEFNESLYDEENPIPMDSKIPNGVIYKVQIGAFRTPPPQDVFKGFAPVRGENTRPGWIRYTAGLFNSIGQARLKRNEIRALGYEDAFVVAYLNGERISLDQAQEYETSGVPVASQPAATSSGEQLVLLEEPTGTSAQEAFNQGVNTPTSNNTATPGEVKQLDEIQGLMYTVQVGAFRTPITTNDLYNISPLVEYEQSGLFKYGSGVYNDRNQAEADKNRIVALGVEDAFVTAFYNGRRVSMAEAAQIAQGGGDVFAEATPITVGASPSPSTSAGSGNVEFRVQIGAYREEVPVDDARVILSLSNLGIEVKQEGDMTTYTVGSYESYDVASEFKNRVQGQGLQGAFVVAFQNGQKIDVQRAIQLSGNQ
ncbi:PD40 domain-containing protein [bacterium SCSIO 12741]|nr:PD40 domain-containing protein [bacterium SCSIO 12741]